MRIKRLLKLFFIALVAAFVLFEGYYVGQVVWYSIAPVKTSAYIESERDRLGRIQFKPVLLKNVANDMVKATVAAEDVRFLEHCGIEWSATGEAFVSNVIEGERAPGGSTITQQTVKNLFLTHEKSYLRKIQEMFLALVMEATWSKGRILQCGRRPFGSQSVVHRCTVVVRWSVSCCSYGSYICTLFRLFFISLYVCFQNTAL